MHFIAPGRLWLLLLVPVVVAAYIVLQRRRKQYALRFTNLALLDRVAPRRPQWRRHLAVALALVAVAAGVVAFARPKDEVNVPRERATIVVAIDVSLSMAATDVDPDRLDAAKKAATTFVSKLPAKFNVSVVSFSGNASVLVPPTTDRDTVDQAINGLQLGPSTAIGEGIFTSLQALTEAPKDPDNPNSTPPARIVLLSDGKTTKGRSAQTGALQAKAQHVPVDTIAFGTDYGTISIEGETEQVPVDKAELKGVADTSGGKAYTAESASQLNDAYTDIGSQVGYTKEDREITSRYAGIAMVLMLVAAGASVLAATRFP